jgi:hypothetical protein
MLVTFTTDAYANITMFGENAHAMLKMMGHSFTVPGAIKAKDVPQALSRLKAAVESGAELPPAVNRNAEEPEVSLADRGLPLIYLLSAAVRAESFVTWDESTSLLLS